jgi:hypothetical protein
MAPEQTQEHWEEIGFHKPIAGFWFRFVFIILEIIIYISIAAPLITYLYPFPESFAYKDTVWGLLRLTFVAFDIGTAGTMDRFISEARINNPTRMIKYIQYFIWYQMTTGLIQVTGIAIYALFFATQAGLAFLVWIMLFTSLIQYPGFLGVFSGVLNSLQQYDKRTIVDFTQNQIIQNITQAIFILAGRAYGQTHPEIGMLLGISIGAIIGTYIDDFIGVVISGYYFKKVMYLHGFTLKKCFTPEFGIDIVKECIVFGLKTSAPYLTIGMVDLFVLTLCLQHIPQYMSYVALYSFASGILSYMNLSILRVTPLYSESYNNGKKILAQNVLTQSWRFGGQILGLFFSLFLVLNHIFPEVFEALGLYTYIGALPFIIPIMIFNSIHMFITQTNDVLLGVGRPNVLFFGIFLEQLLVMLLYYLYVVVFKLAATLPGIIFLLVFMHEVAWILKDTLMYTYIHKKVFKLKFPLMQGVIAPSLSAFVCYMLGVLIKLFVFDPLFKYGVFVAIVPSAILLLMVVLLLYFPLTGYFGGWDTFSLTQFEKVVDMSGPSKPFVKLMYAMLKKFCKISKLHNRFPIENAQAIREAQELYELKKRREQIIQ